ncbi:ACT domain-containing protein [Aquimarina algiphila]|uniref:ACT domain-containing protein n=1 Tax=Aquimarina algiphila TaxID=2047982 RepID=A0A554VNT3_9FLAO|nr:ACT domain-containing protein [Aquimarina algiphila]TSE10050.1 ACT domain-containing protein [Aquimarina algiphila]
MAGETNLSTLIKKMSPELHPGDYVFCTTNKVNQIPRKDIIGEFKEPEGITIILERKIADHFNLSYEYVASWITLKIHSSLDAVGLTAVFSSELAKHNISCNVIAGYYHDHIFVSKKDENQAIHALKTLSETYKG